MNTTRGCDTVSLSLEEPVVHASLLCDCDADIPAWAIVDWSITYDPYLLLYYVLLGALSVLVSVTNVAILAGVLRDEKIQQLHNLLIAGQALCDLAVGLLVSVFTIGTLINNGSMLGGEMGCNVYAFGIVATCNSTVFSLCLIAYSRKVRILDNVTMSFRRAGIIYVVGVWLFPAALTVFNVFVSRGRMVCSGSFCNPIWNPPVMSVTGFTIGTPIAYIVWVYYKIRIRMKESMDSVADYCSNAEVYRNNRTTRLMQTMSTTVMVMWIPLYVFFVFTVAKYLSNGVSFSGYSAFERCLGFCAAGSSLASPIVYAVKNSTLRYAMKYAFLPLSWKYAAEDEYEKRIRESSRNRKNNKKHFFLIEKFQALWKMADGKNHKNETESVFEDAEQSNESITPERRERFSSL